MSQLKVSTERAAMYGLVRALFDYPLTPQLLHVVEGLEVDEESMLAPGLAQMQLALAERGIDDGLVNDLNVEMTGLLEGPGQPIAAPYASYYAHGSLMGPVTIQVAETYRVWGVEPMSRANTPPDHVVHLFGFLAFLADEVDTADPNDSQRLSASRAFIDRFLQPWFARFANTLRDASSGAFFKGVADFALAVVQVDRDWLGLAGPKDFPPTTKLRAEQHEHHVYEDHSEVAT